MREDDDEKVKKNIERQIEKRKNKREDNICAVAQQMLHEKRQIIIVHATLNNNFSAYSC